MKWRLRCKVRKSVRRLISYAGNISRSKIYQIISLYLSTLQGSWKLVNAKQLEIRQISGGLSNLVFYVGLPQGQGRGGREANCILLRYINKAFCIIPIPFKIFSI